MLDLLPANVACIYLCMLEVAGISFLSEFSRIVSGYCILRHTVLVV